MVNIFEIVTEIVEIVQTMLDSFFAWIDKYFGEKE